MGKWFWSYINSDNLIFVGILSAGVAVMYLCTIAFKALRMILAEKKRNILWLFDGCFGPCMFFVLTTAYSGAYSFLRIPALSTAAIEQTFGILLYVNAGWLILSLGKRVLIVLFKVVSQNTMRIYTIAWLVGIGVGIIVLYYRFYAALIFSAIVAIVFIVLVNEITRIAPEIRLGQEETSPRRLIMTHIYIATSETDEAVKRALQAIKQAIETVDGTEKGPYASLAGFTRGAFDILVRYYISVPEKLDEIKQEVNLAIIRTLKDINVKLSER